MVNTIKSKKLLLMLVTVLVAAWLILALNTQKSYADNNEYNASWWISAGTESGVVSKTTLKWDSVPGATAYNIMLSDSSGSFSEMIQLPGSATEYDATEKIITNGPGYGKFEAIILAAGQGVFETMTADLNLYQVTIDTQGHGDNIVVKNVKNGASGWRLIRYKYIGTLDPKVYPNEYYDNGQALVGVALHPASHYTNMTDLEEEMFYKLGSGEIAGTIGINVTLYAVWFDIIDNVSLTVSAPACGTETTTQEIASGYYNFDTQTNKPQLSVPANANYQLKAGYWEADESASEPYIGTLTGGNSYLFQGYLESNYGYVFPRQSDNLNVSCTVNGGTFKKWDGRSMIYGDCLSPTAYGATPLWIIGQVDVEHKYGDWQSDGSTHWKACEYNSSHKTAEGDHDWKGVMTTAPTINSDGEMTYTCTVCGRQRTEVIPKESVIGLVDIGNVWTDLDPFNDVPFTAEINPDGDYHGIPLTDMMEIADESWTSTDGKSYVSLKSPGKAVVGKTYKYKAEVKAKGDYAFADSFDFVYGGRTFAWDSIDVSFSDDHKTAYISGFVADKKVAATNISGATVTGIAARTYTGKAQTQSPVVKVKAAGQVRTLVNGKDFTLSYKNNINAGTATVTITGKGNYTGTISKKFGIAQAAQKMTVKKATRTVKVKKVKKTAQTVAGPVVKNALGTKKFKITKVNKKKKNFTINSKTGKIKVKKGTKKGTYKVTVQVTAGGGNYKTALKKAVVTIKVK